MVRGLCEANDTIRHLTTCLKPLSELVKIEDAGSLIKLWSMVVVQVDDATLLGIEQWNFNSSDSSPGA